MNESKLPTVPNAMREQLPATDPATGIRFRVQSLLSCR